VLIAERVDCKSAHPRQNSGLLRLRAAPRWDTMIAALITIASPATIGIAEKIHRVPFLRRFGTDHEQLHHGSEEPGNRIRRLPSLKGHS
jgi:hypothetical protein